MPAAKYASPLREMFSNGSTASTRRRSSAPRLPRSSRLRRAWRARYLPPDNPCGASERDSGGDHNRRSSRSRRCGGLPAAVRRRAFRSRCDRLSSANTRSRAVWNRLSGAFSRQRRTTRSSDGGTSRRSVARSGGCSFSTACSVSIRLSPVKARRAGEHLVQHAPEREDVGARVGRARRAPVPATCSRRCRAPRRLRSAPSRVASSAGARVGGSVARPKSSSFTLAVAGDEDVLRLEIAMDDAAVVRGGEAAADLRRVVERGRQRQRRRPDDVTGASRRRAAPRRRTECPRASPTS